MIIPVVYDLVPKLKAKYIPFIFWVFIIIRIANISSNHTDYTVRLDYLRSIMEKSSTYESKKLILNEDGISIDTMLMTWASPYEFWLLSTIENNETRSIIITPKPSELNWAAIFKDQFITTWGTFKYDALPSKYFAFRDSSSYIIKNKID